MSAYDEWTNWESGDCLNACEQPSGILPQSTIINRLAQDFNTMVIDWDEGQRWVNARIAKAVEVGYSGILLEAEQALRGCVVLIAIADGSEPRACCVNFYMTPDTGSLELHYEPTGAVERCRNLAVRIGEILNYELEERN